MNTLHNENAGKKYKISKELKSEINWNPQTIMLRIVELYINYSKYPEFVKEVINDKRSYDETIFERALNLLHKN